MKVMSSIKEIIESGNVKFTVKGINHYRRGGENNEWGDRPKIFKINKEGDAIYEDDILLGRGMNINKLGPTCITLYTFDMLGKKTTGKINYKDITVLKETNDIPGFEGTTEALNELTIIK
jgi:hypothetical protein